LPPEEPQQLGRYTIVRVAGRGAMAVVYEALDPGLQRKVALKVLNPNPNAHPEEARLEEERYLREGRLLAGLPKHPNIIGVYEAGVADGRRFLAMEFVEGVPMDQWSKKGSVTLGRPTTILRDVALAVHHAHRHGVIHRDLKPANILVDPEGKPHVMDFGLAKLAGQNIHASYTEGSLAVGTPAYMSPEQAAGSKAVDARTDVYAMGVMLYEILTGRLPFVGASPMEVMIKTSKDPVVPPSKITGIQINPEHFKTLEGICLKALAKNPADRHRTAEEFAADLTLWLRGRDFRVRSARLKKRLIAGAAAALVLIAAGAILAKTRPWRNSVAVETAHAAAPPAPPAPPPDPWANAVNLLAAVELPRDSISGAWMRDGAVILSRDGKPARLQIPYHPPEEYDVRATVSRRPANFCINFILSRAGSAFTLVAHQGGTFGFEKVNGKDFNRNPTAARFDGPLQVGKSYTVLIEVRAGGVKVFCDGQPLSTIDRYDTMTMNPDWRLPDPKAIGIGTWDGGAAIELLELREVSGPGERLPPK